MKKEIIAIIILITFSLGCISENADSTDELVTDIEQQLPEETYANDSKLTNETVNANDPNVNEPITTENTSIENEIISDETIRVGAFNVQVFGVTKASKPEVMEVLADIIRTYDIVAIQEIRDKSQTALPSLVDLVNSDGSEYDYVVSERLGRTSSKEQYAYVYDTQTISVSDSYTYPEPNGTDPFHREPFVTSIEALHGDYTATLAVIHTDPDEAAVEINALDDVLSYAQSQNPGEDDFIIMGDLNADGSYFDEDGTSDLDSYYWVIDDSQDTTTKSTNYTYDRIILTDGSDIVGESGVFRFDLIYGLDEDMTINVSDHYPVFVEFLLNQGIE
ncbi:endonuclease/exonuclease/phosphatase family protein [uncultured Methanolobus sp.]|uniref:exonuclease/endonuclease/phosphatase family protein n=1 Tax=uncultured Methanolobus sp. TaxID=218300 RepID=UPI002AAB07B9|nr:endonuclease/exonuclease/phosphatase family protein [uncultured Methanolobus sp.]